MIDVSMGRYYCGDGLSSEVWDTRMSRQTVSRRVKQTFVDGSEEKVQSRQKLATGRGRPRCSGIDRSEA